MSDGREAEMIKYPCPFCGSSDVGVGLVDWTVGERSKDIYAIRCSDCKSEGPRRTDRKSAIKSWNERVHYYKYPHDIEQYYKEQELQ